MSKRKGDDDDDEPMRSQLSRLDLSGVKRKPEDGDAERKQSRKAIRQIESPYQAMRRDLILANPAAALEVRSLLDAKQHSFLDHVIIMINVRDEAGLSKILDQEKLEPAMAASVFRAVVRNNLLPVIVKMVTDYPQVDIEEAVQDGIRYPSCKVPTMKLVLTLWADEHGETVEAAAKQMLDKAGKDSVILDPARLRALREMAGMPDRGLDEEPEKPVVVPRDEEVKLVELHVPRDYRARPEYDKRWDGIDVEITFTPDGGYLLILIEDTRGLDGSFQIRVLGTDDIDRIVNIWDTGNVAINSVKVATDSKTVYAGGCDRIRVFEIGKPDRVREFQLAGFSQIRRAGIQTMDLSPDGNFIAAGGDRGQVSIVDIATGQVVKELNMVHPRMLKLRYSFDGIFLAGCSGSENKPGTIWDTRTWERSRQFSDIIDIASSPTEPLFATLSSSGLVEIWNPITRKSIRRFQLAQVSSLHGIQFSPRGTRIILEGKTFAVVDIVEMRVVYSFVTDFGVYAVAMNPLDYRIVTFAAAGTDRLLVYDFRGRAAVKALRESVADGLANSAQPQSAWDVFLSRGLYDPRLLLHIMAFTAKF